MDGINLVVVSAYSFCPDAHGRTAPTSEISHWNCVQTKSQAVEYLSETLLSFTTPNIWRSKLAEPTYIPRWSWTHPCLSLFTWRSSNENAISPKVSWTPIASGEFTLSVLKFQTWILNIKSLLEEICRSSPISSSFETEFNWFECLLIPHLTFSLNILNLSQTDRSLTGLLVLSVRDTNYCQLRPNLSCSTWVSSSKYHELRGHKDWPGTLREMRRVRTVCK